jgi:hypothetical protein
LEQVLADIFISSYPLISHIFSLHCSSPLVAGCPGALMPELFAPRGACRNLAPRRIRRAGLAGAVSLSCPQFRESAWKM